MSTPTFKYPNITAPTSTLEFTRGGLIEDYRAATANQIIDESEIGEVQSMSLGDDKVEQQFTVQVPIATQAGNVADVGKLDTFIRTTVGWAARPFYFTDSAGNSYEVKCMNTNLIPSKNFVNYKEYALILREV